MCAVRSCVAARWCWLATVARSGHELPVYPSYYPHEIEIAAMAPERAAELMRAGKLHAYVGGAPASPPRPATRIGTVESLGAFVVVRLNPDSPLANDEASACAAAAAIVRDMAARAGSSGFVAHPYPVTPFHGDYLAHADRAEAARARILGGDAAPLPADLKVRAGGAGARLVRPEWLSDGRLGCRHRGGRRRGSGGATPRLRSTAGWARAGRDRAGSMPIGCSAAR